VERFTQLYDDLDTTTRTNQKVAALVRYFREANPADAAWALYLFSGRRLPRGVNTPTMRQWAAEESQLPAWMLDECYDAVGDFSETIALLLPQPTAPTPIGLAQLITERILPLKRWHEEKRRAVVVQTWRELTTRQRFLFHKLMSGSFRVGVAKTLVVRALAQVAEVLQAVMAYRVMGEWEPTAAGYQHIINPSADEAHRSHEISKPYPFYLAYPLDLPPEELGEVTAWQLEWKWDGIRAQLIRRQDDILIWSRGEELVTDRFPEIVRAADVAVPDGTVLDGELIAWQGLTPLPFAQLQRRIGRKKITPRIMAEVPIVYIVYDLLEWGGTDIRPQPLSLRRHQLESWHVRQATEKLRLSTAHFAQSWEEVRRIYDNARENRVEGLMLKRRLSSYGVGRTKGDWWKWKIEPYHVDAVLIYAQSGSGKRASLFTDYTFGVWHEGQLVPVAKAYSGLSDAEIREVDRFIRSNTLDRHGPVRVVKPELVFELAFEGIQRSTRHKAGVAVRFPRMARWRKDKPAQEADTLETLQALIKKTEAG
jgi:DNA ligase-1